MSSLKSSKSATAQQNVEHCALIPEVITHLKGHFDFRGAPTRAFLQSTSSTSFPSAAFPRPRRVRFVLPATQDDTVNKCLISRSVVSCTKYNYMVSQM